MLQSLIKEVNKVVLQTGRYLQNEQRNRSGIEIETKSLNSLVSYVDKAAEEKLVEGLSKILPEAGFITEEQTVSQEKKAMNWVIDPLDGTTNFLHGIPAYSISVALLRNDELVLGAVYEVCQQELFYAWQGGGAYLNGHPIRVSKNTQMGSALLATGFPYYDFERLDNYLQVLKAFFENTRGVRRIGSAAVDLAYVACGRFDGFFEYGLSPWDVAGGTIIVREAGGRVTNFFDEADAIFGKQILAASAGMHPQILKQLQKHRL